MLTNVIFISFLPTFTTVLNSVGTICEHAFCADLCDTEHLRIHSSV